jgi:type I restriction enzyme S subunit
MSSKTKTNATEEEATPALVPKLRFPEFRDADGWKQTPLEDCLDYQQPTPYLVADTKYSPAFKIPVLTAGKTFILGYTDEQHGIFSEGLPVIIFDDFTTATQFVDFPFKAKSSAMKILEAKNGADIKFMYETLQTLSYEVGAHERHWISNFAPMLVPVPKPAEQQKIAECLSSMDELIGAESRKLDALKDHKKGLMQELFPREGETQPRLRFPEFQNAGEWVEEKLDDLIHLQDGFAFKSTDFVKSKGDATQVIRITDINNKNINEDKVFISNLFLESNNLTKYSVEDGDLLLSLTGAAGFNFFFWDGGRAVINQRTAKVTPKKKSSRALLQLLEPLIYEKINERGEGQNNNLSKEFLSTIVLLVPEPAEQQRIASCLGSLDALITAAIQKLEALKTHKQGLMQQLFPSPEEVES